MTYDEAVTRWLEFRLAIGDVREDTAKKAAYNARKFSPYFGGKQLEDITVLDIENAIVDLRVNGNTRYPGRLASNNTLNKFHGAGMKCYAWALDRELCSSGKNPFKKATKPKKGKSVKPNALTPEEAKRFSGLCCKELEITSKSCCITRSKQQEIFTAVAAMIALGAGLRFGEVYALDWENVTPTHICVRQAWKNGGTIEEPKNNSSIRNISIGTELWNILDNYREWQQATGSYIEIDGAHPLFVANGKRFSYDAAHHAWEKVRRAYGFPHLRFHDLRHTHATLLIASGVDVKTVQMRMGHCSAVMTLDVYAHAVPRNDVEAANDISSELFVS